MKYIMVGLICGINISGCTGGSSSSVKKGNALSVPNTLTDSLKQIDAVFPSKASEIGRISNLNSGCTFNRGLSQSSVSLYYPDDRALEEIKVIVSYSGLPMNFEVYRANISNALAATVNGRRIILYDGEFFSFTEHVSKTYWASASILAHEIGHHLSGHTLSTREDQKSDELEADKFSGFMLYKMGATKAQSILAISLLGDDQESMTHPGKQLRIAAISQGWEDAAKLRYNGAVPPPPQRQIPEIEYTTQMLYGKEKFMDDDIQMESSGLFEGTITEVDPDYNAGGIEIYTEKAVGGIDQIGLVNKREIFNAPVAMGLGEALDNKMSRVDWSWMDEVFKPGRKIQFRYVAVGSGGHLYLTYIKVIR